MRLHSPTYVGSKLCAALTHRTAFAFLRTRQDLIVGFVVNSKGRRVTRLQMISRIHNHQAVSPHCHKPCHVNQDTERRAFRYRINKVSHVDYSRSANTQSSNSCTETEYNLLQSIIPPAASTGAMLHACVSMPGLFKGEQGRLRRTDNIRRPGDLQAGPQNVIDCSIHPRQPDSSSATLRLNWYSLLIE